MSGDMSSYSWQIILQSLLSLVLSLLYIPLRSTGVILAYFDLRVRYESFDLAVLAHQAETGVSQADELAALSLEDEEKEKPFSGPTIGKFVALSLIGVVLYFVFVAIAAGIMTAIMPTLV